MSYHLFTDKCYTFYIVGWCGSSMFLLSPANYVTIGCTPLWSMWWGFGCMYVAMVLDEHAIHHDQQAARLLSPPHKLMASSYHVDQFIYSYVIQLAMMLVWEAGKANRGRHHIPREHWVSYWYGMVSQICTRTLHASHVWQMGVRSFVHKLWVCLQGICSYLCGSMFIYKSYAVSSLSVFTAFNT